MTGRRSFFATVLGALCAPFLPKPKLARPQLTDRSGQAILKLQEQVGQGSIYRSGDVACNAEEFARLCQPHLEAARRALAEAIEDSQHTRGAFTA